MPRNLSNLGRASLLKIVERVYENRNRGDVLSASEYWEFISFFTNLSTIFGG